MAKHQQTASYGFVGFAVFCSLTSEVCNTLFDVCRDAFLGVAAVEQGCLQFTLEGQVVLEWNLWTGLAGTLDVSNGFDGLVW